MADDTITHTHKLARRSFRGTTRECSPFGPLGEDWR